MSQPDPVTLRNWMTDVDVDAVAQATADAVANRAARVEADGETLDEAHRRQFALSFLAEHLNEVSRNEIRAGRRLLNGGDRKEITDLVMGRVFSLTPGLEQWLARRDVTDIHVNGWDDVRIELMDGTYLSGQPFVRSDKELEEWIQTIARRAGREKAFNPANPRVRTRLPDGSRFAATGFVTHRPYVSIRCHRLATSDMTDLCRLQMFAEVVRSLLVASVRARLNVMIAGAFGVGKTTVMRAMLHDGLAVDERVAVMEEEPELFLAESRPDLHNQVMVLETRDPNTEGQGSYEYGDLSRTMKWHKPSRIVVGEVQGAEVIDMLEAVTSGAGGALCTMHSKSSADVFDRIVMYAEKGDHDWNERYILRRVTAALDLVVYVTQTRDGRRVVSDIRQVRGFDPRAEQIITNEIFIPGPDGSAVPNPRCQISTDLLERLIDAGYAHAPRLHPNGAEGWRR